MRNPIASLIQTLAICLLFSLPLAGQVFGVDGTFLVEALQIETSGGRNLEQVRQAFGPMVIGSGGDVQFNGNSGVLMEDGFGRFLLSSPFAQADAALRILASEGGEVLIGSSPGVHGIDNLFVAVRQPSDAIALLPDTTFQGGIFRMVPGAAPLAESRSVTLDPTTNAISLGADGQGTATLSGVGNLRIAISANGNYLVGAPVDGQPGILFAVRKAQRPPSGLLFSAMLSIGRDALRSGTGSAVLTAAGELRVSQQEHYPAGNGDLRGVRNLPLWTSGQTTSQGHLFTSGIGNSMVAAGTAADEAFLAAFIPAPQPVDSGGLFLHPHGIVDAASMASTSNPLAPGGLVSLFGLRFAEQTIAAETIPLPNTLGDVSVNVNGNPAGLLLVSPGQINLHLPAELQTDEAVFEVSGPTGSSARVRASVSPSAPAVFSTNQSGTGAAVVTHADFQLVSTLYPARGGEVVILFLTGMGNHQPPPVVFVNGDVAELQYAGPHSVFVGLYQMNIKLPMFLSADPQATLTLRGRDGWSDTVTLAITP